MNIENELYCLGRAISSAVNDFCDCNNDCIIQNGYQDYYIREKELQKLIYKATRKYIAERHMKELDKYDDER